MAMIAFIKIIIECFFKKDFDTLKAGIVGLQTKCNQTEEDGGIIRGQYLPNVLFYMHLLPYDEV